MPFATASPQILHAGRLLDVLAEARSAEAALAQFDLVRRLFAGEGGFSIQRNVTTAHDPAGEIRLQRFYSSQAKRFPVDSVKRKTATPWTECLFLHGRVFVGEGEEVLARTFDDFDQMRLEGLRSVVNMPLMRGNVCYATFNVFGVSPRWLPEEILAIRMLALAAARWVPAAPGLSYRLGGTTLSHSLEA